MWRRMLTRLQPEQHRLAGIFIHKKHYINICISASWNLSISLQFPKPLFLWSFFLWASTKESWAKQHAETKNFVPYKFIRSITQNNMQKQRILFLTSFKSITHLNMKKYCQKYFSNSRTIYRSQSSKLQIFLSSWE